MSKTKKIVLTSITAIFLVLICYFFTPKTVVDSGNLFPPLCTVTKCSMGIPYNPTPFGGNGYECFMGKLLERKTVECSELK